MSAVTVRAESLPTTSLGHYAVRAKIGSGGMGDVYDAVHTGLDKRVALKTLRKRYLDDEVVVARFLREGQLASRIRHPNIVDVTDVGMMGGLPCLVMELLEGESLSAMIRREGRLSIETVVDLLLPIVAAVDFAHDHGIVHRDLKPSNVFLSRSWNGEIVPKVLDFGISKLVHDSREALTTDSAFVGTPHYASPELMRAEKLADGRSDQYSMGVILYETTTGIRPFAAQGNNFVALAMAVCKGEYPSPRERNPDLPASFEVVVQRAMALEAHERFLTMRALGEALLPFASPRARMIWKPTFVGRASQPPPPESTAQAPLSMGTIPVGQSVPAAFGAGPASGAARPTRISATPPPSIGPALFMAPTTSPSSAHDRLPSAGGPHPAPVAAPRGSAMITAVIGVSLGLAVVMSMVMLRGARREDALRAATAPSAVPTFTVDVAVTPNAASIELDGAGAGTGRVSKAFVRDGKSHALRLSAPGYESLLVEFSDATPPPTTIALRPLAVPTGAPPAAPTPSTADAPSGQRRAPGGGKVKGSSEGRPKTDNIDPWQ
jgi:eukaryotic-like serine/threonine-protein kinase